MRVLVVSSLFPPFDRGGSEIYAFELAKLLQKNGVQASALTWFPAKKDYSIDGIEVKVLPDISSYFSRSRASKTIGVLKVFRRVLKLAKDFDLVHLNNVDNGITLAGLFFALKLLRKPVVWTVHGAFFACPKIDFFCNGKDCSDFECKKKCNEKKPDNGLFKLSDFAVVPSEALRKKLVLWGFDKKKTVVLQHFVETKKKKNTGKKTVLFVGSVEKGKGVGFLAKAVPKILEAVPKARFVFVGDVKDREEFSVLDKKGFGGKVSFVNRVAHGKIGRYYGRAAVLVVPSVFFENSPLVIYEAMAQGVPVVASRVGGIPELVENGREGFLVEPKDSGAIAGKVVRILNDKKLAKRMSENCLKRARKEFSPEKHARTVLKIYNQLLKSSD